MSNIRTVKIILALSAAAAVLILHGLSFCTAAVLLYIFGTVFVKGSRAVVTVTILLGGLSLLSIGGTLAPALLLAGSVLVIAFSDSAFSRYLFLLSIAIVVIFGAVGGIVPLLAASLVASLIKKEMQRCIILAAGFLLVLIISGLPHPLEFPSFESDEVLTDNEVLWPEPVELNLCRPELILQYPRKDISDITLRVSAGGVRDSNPVGFIASGSMILSVYPGENTILIEEPEFPVTIRMSRHWKPFTHPIIHLHSAEASI